jgi:hypothetical protein
MLWASSALTGVDNQLIERQTKLLLERDRHREHLVDECESDVDLGARQLDFTEEVTLELHQDLRRLDAAAEPVLVHRSQALVPADGLSQVGVQARHLTLARS